MWAKIKGNPAAAVVFLGVIAAMFLLHVPAVKASQYHEALEWLIGVFASIAILFIRALFGAEAKAIEDKLALPASKDGGQ